MKRERKAAVHVKEEERLLFALAVHVKEEEMLLFNNGSLHETGRTSLDLGQH